MSEAAYERSGDALTRLVDGEIVMFHPTRGEYFALGATGSRIWQLLERPISMSAVCGQLRQEFDVDAETCHTQVRAFLDELASADLVEERRP